MGEKEPPRIIREIVEGGEPVITTAKGGILTSYVAGVGENLRAAFR